MGCAACAWAHPVFRPHRPLACVSLCFQRARCTGVTLHCNPAQGGLMLHVVFQPDGNGRRPPEQWHEHHVAPEEVLDLAKQLVADFRVAAFVGASRKGIVLALKCTCAPPCNSGSSQQRWRL